MGRVQNEEWKVLYEQGKAFRIFSHRAQCEVGFWASDTMEAWIDKGLAWAKDHPGVGFSEDDSDDEYYENDSGE